jgi:hypothetical protein
MAYFSHGETNCCFPLYFEWVLWYNIEAKRRDVAQLGSALAWGARGRKFKSCRPDHWTSGGHQSAFFLSQGSPTNET